MTFACPLQTNVIFQTTKHDFHLRGILMHGGSSLVERIKERYARYMFLEGMPEESKNAPFYQRHGFTLMEDGRALQLASSF